MQALDTLCTAFVGSRIVAEGELKLVASAAKIAFDEQAVKRKPLPVLVFNDVTSEIIELDWRGSTRTFATRLSAAAKNSADATPRIDDPQIVAGGDADSPRGPGRPRLGVIAREVTLLPRHWQWLNTQTGGASVALRKLVEVARRASETKDRVRIASERGYKFMSTMAGHEVGFEEAGRALFAGDQAGFEALIAGWPNDVQTHLKKILLDAFWP